MFGSVHLRRRVAALVAGAMLATIVPARAGIPPAPPNAAALALADLTAGCGTAPEYARLLVAQAAPTTDPGLDPNAGASPTPSPAPSGPGIGSSVFHPAPSGAPATAAPTPGGDNGDAVPTATPVPNGPPEGRPATGPQIIVVPTLPPAVALPTPPPVPTPMPSPAKDESPVYLDQRPAPAPSLTPVGQTPNPNATPAPKPTTDTELQREILGPDRVGMYFDESHGGANDGDPIDASGNVNIVFSEGVIVGDKMHYDGKRYADVTGNAYLRNRANDSIVHADRIRFDTLEQKAYLGNTIGVTTQGVEKGKLHFTAQTFESERDGISHGTNASLTTCETSKSGYNLKAKTLDIFPGDKAIARKVTVYLGVLAVFFIPLLIIPLNRIDTGRRPTPLLPEFGYSATTGVFVKARIGFGTSNTYYGTYRLEEYQKLGPAFGYQAHIGRLDNRRSTDINFYRNSNAPGTNSNSFGLNDTENFSRALHAQLGFQYTGNYGPQIYLPPSTQVNLAVSDTTSHANDQVTYSRSSQGSQSENDSYGFSETRQLSPRLSQGFTVTDTRTFNSYTGASTSLTTLNYQAITHLTSPGVDYTLNFNRTDSDGSTGVDRLPELLIAPHGLFTNQHVVPITTTLDIGEYRDASTTTLATQRVRADLTLGDAVFHEGINDFTGRLTLRQDYYGTGDLKASVAQFASVTTQVTKGITNFVTYNEQNSNGPQFVPLRDLDALGGDSHGAQDTLRFSNSDVYSFSLSSGTFFDRQAQPVGYTLIAHPSRRSYLSLQGSFDPGSGNGFGPTNVQVSTPFGRDQELQFTTDVDWKAGTDVGSSAITRKLTNKNIYFRKIVGQCYEIRLQYNQSTKQVSGTVIILAFPSRAGSFGLGQGGGSIIPQNLNF